MTATDARPSAIGEVLNRAIALYGRRFVPLFLILAVYAIPAGVLGAVAAPDVTHVIQTLGALGSLPAGDTLERARLLNELSHAAPGGWLTFDFYAFELLCYPPAHTALIVYAAADADTPTIASAYRVALRRWLPQVVVTCAFLALGFVGAIGFVLAGTIVGFALFTLGFVSRSLEYVAGLGAELAAVAGMVVAFALGFLAWQTAGISVALDDGNPVRAIVRGVRRTLDRPLLRRTLATALTVIALELFGSLAIVVSASLIDDVTHLTALDRILAGSGGVALDGLCTVFVLLYARDVQLRREGSDLLLVPAPDALPLDERERDDGLDPSDRILIARFLARRATLEPRAAGEIAAHIAARVRPKLRASFHYLNDADLLEHLGR